MEFIGGLLIGAFIILIIVYFFRNSFIKSKTESTSVILLEKIRRVSKMITVEGDFSEIMHFEDVKDGFLNIVSSKKKAIVLSNAKVMVGFDMRKVTFTAEPKQKRLILTSFPEPEVLSIENDVQFYDVKNGLFNKFDASNLSNLNKEVRKRIEEKVPESGLLLAAKDKAVETITIIEQLVGTFGWKLDYSTLITTLEKTKKIN